MNFNGRHRATLDIAKSYTTQDGISDLPNIMFLWEVADFG